MLLFMDRPMYMYVIVKLYGMVPVYSLHVTVQISWHRSLYADTGGIFVQMPGKILVGTGRSIQQLVSSPATLLYHKLMIGIRINGKL